MGRASYNGRETRKPSFQGRFNRIFSSVFPSPFSRRDVRERRYDGLHALPPLLAALPPPVPEIRCDPS